MKILRMCRITGLCLASVASVAKADSKPFTGFQIGGLVGISGMHWKDESGTNGYLSKSGGSFGLYLGYGMIFSGLFVGIDGNLTFPIFYMKTDFRRQVKYISSSDLALRFGMELNKAVLPYVRLGHAANCIEINSFSAFTYGVGIDTKLAPTMVLGLEGMQTVDSQRACGKMHFNTARIKVAFHL